MIVKIEGYEEPVEVDADELARHRVRVFVDGKAILDADALYLMLQAKARGSPNETRIDLKTER